MGRVGGWERCPLGDGSTPQESDRLLPESTSPLASIPLAARRPSWYRAPDADSLWSRLGLHSGNLSGDGGDTVAFGGLSVVCFCCF